MARRIGAVYLAYFAVAFLGAAVSGLASHALGGLLELCSFAVYAAVVVLFYRFFTPVDRNLSLTAAVVGIAGCIVGALSVLHLVPQGVNQLLVFAVYDLLLGWLILKAAFPPRAFGILMIAAGVGWLIYVAPGTSAVAPYLMGLGIVAELALMLRLLVGKGESVYAISTSRPE